MSVLKKQLTYNFTAFQLFLKKWLSSFFLCPFHIHRSEFSQELLIVGKPCFSSMYNSFLVESGYERKAKRVENPSLLQNTFYRFKL